MKFTEKDLQKLVEDIKEFRAGIIDKKLDEHIDECVRNLKKEVSTKKWWNRLKKAFK